MKTYKITVSVLMETTVTVKADSESDACRKAEEKAAELDTGAFEWVSPESSCVAD